MRLLSWALLLGVLGAGCGGSTSSDATSGGAGGTGTPDAGGGSGGSGGGPGSGGGASGSGGGAAGGMQPTPNDAGIAPQCVRDTDCKVAEDCCACQAVPQSSNPPTCFAACTQNKCADLGVTAPKASCISGRCTMAFSCDSLLVLCRAAAPNCPPEQVPLVQGSCWQGSCVPAIQCRSVKDCSQCTGSLACANYNGPAGHCYEVPEACNGDYSCACGGKTVCTGGFSDCRDLSGVKGVMCSCPTC